MQTAEPMLTVDELAQLVNVSVNTVRTWVKNDTVPYLKAGKLVRFDPAEIHAWLRSKEGSMARHPRNGDAA